MVSCGTFVTSFSVTPTLWPTSMYPSWTDLHQLLHFLSTPHQSHPVLCMIFLVSFCSLCKHASSEKSSDCTTKTHTQISPSARYSSYLPMVFELTNLLSLPRLFLFKIIHKNIVFILVFTQTPGLSFLFAAWIEWLLNYSLCSNVSRYMYPSASPCLLVCLCLDISI